MTTAHDSSAVELVLALRELCAHFGELRILVLEAATDPETSPEDARRLAALATHIKGLTGVANEVAANLKDARTGLPGTALLDEIDTVVRELSRVQPARNAAAFEARVRSLAEIMARVWPQEIAPRGVERGSGTPGSCDEAEDGGAASARYVAQTGRRKRRRKPGPAQFHFLLRGQHTRGATIIAHTVASLEFRYARPPADALAVGDSKALDEARRADLDIDLHLTARGDIEILGSRHGTAKFREGALLLPVAFEVKAGSASSQKTSLHVDFAVRGESLYQMELALTVVQTTAELAGSAADAVAATVDSALLDDAKAVGPSPAQRIELSLSIEGDRFCIELSDWRDGEREYQDRFVAKALDRTRLEVLLKKIHAELGPVYKDVMWARYDGSVPAPEHAGVVKSALRRTLETVAVAGSCLNAYLRHDPEIARALDYIEGNARDGALLTITTDDIFLPWEILYPGVRTANMSEALRAAHPMRPERFWGARFAIETVQRGIGSQGQLRRAQLARSPAVCLNLNPTIAVDDPKVATQPLDVQIEWARRLSTAGRLDGIRQTCRDIQAVLQDAGNDAPVIYVYCHGSSPNPFGGAGEMLVLDEGCNLTPDDVGIGPPFKSAPIIVLNSCGSGAYSPLTFSSFLSEFRKRGALGMIATTYSVPVVFGAYFGESVVDCVLRRRGLLAARLLDLRREHLVERGNPVPLFYAVQCHIDFGIA
jgi:hypothetical protein